VSAALLPVVPPGLAAAPGGGNGADVTAPAVARTGRVDVVAGGFTTDGDEAFGGTAVTGERLAGGGDELQAAAKRMPTSARARVTRRERRSGAFITASEPAAPRPAAHRAAIVTPNKCPRILLLLSLSVGAFRIPRRIGNGNLQPSVGRQAHSTDIGRVHRPDCAIRVLLEYRVNGLLLRPCLC
jgi:hypothetical protein